MNRAEISQDIPVDVRDELERVGVGMVPPDGHTPVVNQELFKVPLDVFGIERFPPES